LKILNIYHVKQTIRYYWICLFRGMEFRWFERSYLPTGNPKFWLFHRSNMPNFIIFPPVIPYTGPTKLLIIIIKQ